MKWKQFSGKPLIFLYPHNFSLSLLHSLFLAFLFVSSFFFKFIIHSTALSSFFLSFFRSFLLSHLHFLNPFKKGILLIFGHFCDFYCARSIWVWCVCVSAALDTFQIELIYNSSILSIFQMVDVLVWSNKIIWNLKHTIFANNK